MKNPTQPHELAKLIPPPSKEQYRALTESIGKHGLRNPIVTYEGKILDGRSRLVACTNIGVTPTFTEYTGDDPLEYVLDRNLYKRALSKAQVKALDEKVGEIRIREMLKDEDPLDDVVDDLPPREKGDDDKRRTLTISAPKIFSGGGRRTISTGTNRPRR